MASMELNNRKSTGKSVFVIDNDPIFCLLVSAFLDGTDMTVTHVESADEVIEISKKEGNVDIVLINTILPDLDGIQAINNLRKNLTEVLLIGYSPYEFNELMELAFNAGADDFIFQPENKERFLEIFSLYIEEELHTLKYYFDYTLAHAS
ncbi:MAG: response regulator [Bacteroidota bacterium]